MVIALKKHKHTHALAALAALILVAVAAFAIKFGGPIRSGVQLYTQAVPNDEAVYQKADGVLAADSCVALEDISPEFLKTLLHEEDRRFYSHLGVDPIAVARAAYANLKSGKIVQGASTITMQLARNLFFTQERTTVRKIAETLAALKLETLLTKDEILELYCNAAYFGEGCYGIRAASEYYYNIEPSELNAEQSAALVYTLRAPSYWHPEPAAPAA